MRPPFTIIEDETPLPQTVVPVDPALADAPIARIRKQVQGNGLRPSSVELRGISGHVHGFYGTTSVRLTPNVQEGRRAGRFTDGQIIQPQQIEGAIEEFIGKVAKDRGVLGLVYDTVLARADQGFGLVGETIPLPQVARTFLAHEACPKCRGTGGTACHNCHGQMRITCYRCHGQGGVSCITCQGRGQILTPQGPVTCHACAGRGLSQCPVCMGQRMIVCPECQGHGKKVCETCQGQGWNTHTWTVTLTAETSFRMRTQGLPAGLVSLIERVGGARLAADRHAQITPITGRAAEELSAEADIGAGASLWFLYRAEMPFAELEISMGKASIKPKLAGFKARLIDVPDFMDALLRPGADALAAGAAGGSGATQKILEAARYRAIGDILRGLVRASQKKILKSVMETYTLGLSTTFAQRIVRDAATALSRLSLWPRTVTMAVALGVSVGISAAFYLYGLRTKLVLAAFPAGTSALVTTSVDILFVVVLGAAGTQAIRVAASRSSRAVLEGLGVVSGGRLPLPKPGAPGLWLWVGIIGMTGVFAFLAGLLR